MIHIELTRAELLAAGADCDGLSVFDSLALARWGGDRLRYDWTEDRQIWALLCEDVRPHVGWLIDVGLLPRIVLPRADLSGADLSGAYLTGANLSRANLRDADLSWADLSRANLSRADLSGADLRWADLRWAYRYSDDPPIPGWTVADCRLQRSA